MRNNNNHRIIWKCNRIYWKQNTSGEKLLLAALIQLSKWNENVLNAFNRASGRSTEERYKWNWSTFVSEHIFFPFSLHEKQNLNCAKQQWAKRKIPSSHFGFPSVIYSFKRISVWHQVISYKTLLSIEFNVTYFMRPILMLPGLSYYNAFTSNHERNEEWKEKTQIKKEIKRS